MRKFFITILMFVTLAFNICPVDAQTTEIQYLSGTGKDDPVEWDFFCTKGRNSGKWTKIGVPSNWELQGFGTYNYGHDKNKADEQGLYKYSFTVPKEWAGKEIFIVFDGSMTDTEVKINGKLAGPVHQGAFYQFRHNVTSLIKPGRKNLLEATVSKMSANATVNEAERTADFWVFGGIFRPVWLEAHPAEYIERMAVDARADGSYVIDVFPGKPQAGFSLEARLYSSDGKEVGSPVTGTTGVAPSSRLKGVLYNPSLWSPEFPNLYTLKVTLKQGDKALHTVAQKIGFRTVDLRERDGIYINGQKIRFKGVNRHSFYPTSGRTTSKALSIADVKLMKEMNMNAVRMSHYPPDSHFLDVCDSLGLFVLDELTAWQYPPYDTEVGTKLVHELVKRDVNHPSVVMWDNGNEGGFNFDLVPVFKQLDPQQRPVIHPWMLSGGADTQHYTAYNYGAGIYFNGHDIFFPTEFSHGLYDGGHGATLDDFWNLMLYNPLSAGGFLWDFCDQAVVRTDKEGFLDTSGNLGADGIVGPYREKEGSFYTIREIWSPLFFEKRFITPVFDGTFPIENRYHYTNLNQCRFSWKLKRFDNFTSSSQAEGTIASPDLAPWQRGILKVGLPAGWEKYDVLYITATDPHGLEINTWSWNISLPEAVAERWTDRRSGTVKATEAETSITLEAQGVQASFDKKTGLLTAVRRNGELIPLSKGPLLIEAESSFNEIKQYAKEEAQVVEVNYQGRHPFHFTWTMHPSGLLELNYDYRQSGQWWLMGITFDFPEELVKGAALLANGPYRVWKNRLKGVTFDLHEKTYNNTVTGESWDYPEFKGYYSNFYGVRLNAGEAGFTVLAASEDLYLHLFTPEKPKGAANANTSPVFPNGNLSFLHAISPVGTKFQSSEIMGPQGQKNMYSPNRNQANMTGRLFFDFRK